MIHLKLLNCGFVHTDYISSFVWYDIWELMFVPKWEMMVISDVVYVEDNYALFCVYKWL